MSANAHASMAFAAAWLAVFIILQCHDLRSQTHMNKATHCFALTSSRNAPHIRIPDLFCAFCAKNLSMLMCGVRQGLSNARASSAFARLWLTALFILVAMTSCSQTCMNKATHCSAPRALSQCSNHSESARFARKARAKRLLPHVWAFAKASRTFVRARCSFGFGSLLCSYFNKHRTCVYRINNFLYTKAVVNKSFGSSSIKPSYIGSSNSSCKNPLFVLQSCMSVPAQTTNLSRTGQL